MGLPSGDADAIVKRCAGKQRVRNRSGQRYSRALRKLPRPEEKLKAIRAVAETAHKAGNNAFVYIAGTECITAHGDQGRSTRGQGPSGLAATKDHRRARDFSAAARRSGSGRAMRMCGSVPTHRVAQDLHGARAADCSDRDRRDLRRYSVLDDAFRWLGKHLGELRRLHGGCIQEADRTRCEARSEDRRLFRSQVSQVGGVPHQTFTDFMHEIDANARSR